MANWQKTTLQKAEMIAADVKALTFRASSWTRHEAGQHYDIRLASSGGYQPERSYSIASPPEEEDIVEFGIQLLENGEVSPYLFELKAGEQVEIRGPVGRHFTWNVNMPGPLVLIGGGSGMVPLMSMLRHYVRHGGKREIIFLASARTIDHVPYKSELEEIAKKFLNVNVVYTITDTQPPGWRGYSRRVDEPMLREALGSPAGTMPMIYVCGPTPFVETGANLLMRIGFNSRQIRTERFGGTEMT